MSSQKKNKAEKRNNPVRMYMWMVVLRSEGMEMC